MKIRWVGLLVALALLGACGSAGPGRHASRPPGSTPGSVSSVPGPLVTLTTGPVDSPADHAACAQLYAHLRQVTAALDASSQLIATSQDKQQLSERIEYERSQLQHAADLMAQGPIPPSLVEADRDIVAALRAFTADFARAEAPAARGDFRATAAAMTDKAVVQRIVDASKTIEDACT